METAEKHKIYNLGFEAGRKHQSPSEETKKFMLNAEIAMNKLSMEVSNIKEKLETIPNRDEMKLAIKECIDTSLETLDKRYASKAVEKMVWTLAGALLVAFIGIIIFTIEGHIEF